MSRLRNNAGGDLRREGQNTAHPTPYGTMIFVGGKGLFVHARSCFCPVELPKLPLVDLD